MDIVETRKRVGKKEKEKFVFSSEGE